MLELIFQIWDIGHKYNKLNVKHLSCKKKHLSFISYFKNYITQ